MEKFLSKKWLGPVTLILYTLCFSLFVVHKITPHLREALPVVIQEAGNFLPMTIQNGQVVQPSDTIISRSYSSEGKTFNIVLDTRTETLDINTLSDGIYLSKKCFYVVSSEESKVRCMDPSLSSGYY